MQTLQRLLATSVVEALERREHVIVAPGGTDALLAELEGILAPSLPAITATIPPPPMLFGAVASRLNAQLDHAALEAVVEEIAQRLLESDHVDDIFADDRAIRRDALRALHDGLVRYGRGELEVGAEPVSDVGSRVGLAVPSSSAPRCHVASDELGVPDPSDSYRWVYPAHADVVRSDPGAEGCDEHVSYFLETLERALAVLGEEGEGPPSAPAELRCGDSTRPPGPARAPRSSKARRRPPGSSRGARSASVPDRQRAGAPGTARPRGGARSSEARLSSGPGARRPAPRSSTKSSASAAKPRATPRRGAGEAPAPPTPRRARANRPSKRPPKR